MNPQATQISLSERARMTDRMRRRLDSIAKNVIGHNKRMENPKMTDKRDKPNGGAYPPTSRSVESSHSHSRKSMNDRSHTYGDSHFAKYGSKYGSKNEPDRNPRPVHERLSEGNRPVNPGFDTNRFGHGKDNHRKHSNNNVKTKEQLEKELEEYMMKPRRKKVDQDAECRKKRK